MSGYGYTWGASGNFLDITFSNPASATINVTVVGNSDPCLSQLYANHTFQVSSNCGNAPAPISQNTTDLKITVPNSANERNGEKDVINLNVLDGREITVTPNPASDEFTLRMVASGDYVLRVYDALGRLQHQQTADADGSLRINSRGWQSGIYLLDLTERGKMLHWKGRVVIQRAE